MGSPAVDVLPHDALLCGECEWKRKVDAMGEKEKEKIAAVTKTARGGGGSEQGGERRHSRCAWRLTGIGYTEPTSGYGPTSYYGAWFGITETGHRTAR
eukprot:2847398-Rhodomonas_salina.1